MDDPPGRVGRVAEVRGGQAWMQEGGEGEWFELVRNRPLTTGDRISTERDTRIVIQIGSSTLRLGGGSEASIERLDDDRVDIALDTGAAALRIREPEAIREFGLNTREGAFAARSTGSFRIDRDEFGLQAASYSGDIQFTGSGRNFVLHAGQSARLRVEPGRMPELVWGTLSGDDFEQWVRSEDARLPPRMSQGPVSWEMTGADDLARNGQWETHPEYGPVWTPIGVAVDWAPYRYGRWVSVRPWGWTWVDDAPWGFAPFHYGRWVYWGQRWCWAPGEYVRRPVYAPAMVAWVGGKNWGVSMTLGGAPTVGWVPLAPREVYVPTYRHSIVYVQKVNVTHVHLPPTYREVENPGRPISYANQGRPGGIGVMEARNFEKHEPRGLTVRPTPALANLANKPIALERTAAPELPVRAVANPDGAQVRRFPGGAGRAPGAEIEDVRARPAQSRAETDLSPARQTPGPITRHEINGDSVRDPRDRREADTNPPAYKPVAPQLPAQNAPPERTPKWDRQEKADRPDRADVQDRVPRPDRPERQDRQERAQPVQPVPMPVQEAPKRQEPEKPQPPKVRNDADRKPGKGDPRRDNAIN